MAVVKSFLEWNSKNVIGTEKLLKLNSFDT